MGDYGALYWRKMTMKVVSGDESKLSLKHSVISSCNIGIWGSFLVILGTTVPVVTSFFLQPKQPPWTTVEAFVEHYSMIQVVPIYFGFALVGGSLMLLAAIYLMSDRPVLPFIGLVFGIVGSTVVVLNYVIQTTYIPSLVAQYGNNQRILIQMLTMANPDSLAWALEMWGYGFLGIGTLFCAPFFGDSRIEKTAKILFVSNGILCIVGALWTAADLSWVLSIAGLISFVVWNLVYLSLAIVSMLIFINRKHVFKNL